MRTKEFWLDTAERVGSTFAQALLALITVAVFDPKNLVGWQTALIGAAFTAGISFLKCIVATRIGDPDSASLIIKAAPVDGWDLASRKEQE